MTDEFEAKTFGGQPKISYWTPDGREIRAMPDIHEYAVKDEKGKVIRSGTRDANLDKGWLTTKPTDPKLFCPHCDKWHDTGPEIAACGQKKNNLIAKYENEGKKELAAKQDGRIDKLEADMRDIKGMLQMILEKS